MKTTSKIIATVAATVSLAIAGGVAAQPGFGMGSGWGGMGPGWGHMGGAGPGWGHMGGMGPGWGYMSGFGYDMTAAVTARLGDLKTLLKITATQETAWKAYESAVTQQTTAMQALREQMHARWQNTQPGAAAPDMAAQHQAMIALRDSSLQAQNTALKDLYAVLTPEQRVVADRNLNFMGAQRGPGRYPAR